MQTLGLSSEDKRSDGRLKSIFWPTVETAWDVDYLGRQGFWVCVIIAVFQLVAALLAPSLLNIIAGLFAALLYLLAGMGIREKCWPAAAVIFACYLTETFIAFAMGTLITPIGGVKIVFLALLLSNVRATFLASERRPPAEGEDRPERYDTTIVDKMVDAWPPKLWPFAQIPFYALGALWILFSLFAIAGLMLMRLGLIPTRGLH